MKISAAIAVFALGAAACAPGVPASAKYSFLTGTATGTWPLISTPVVLMADNQTQHLYGDPFWMRSEVGVRFVHTAVRPLQLDLYGQDLMRWVIDFDNDSVVGTNPGTPIIHLGDGLNFSCQSEMDRFFANMSTAKVPWAMAPGNHDGYFFGNEGSDPDWAIACKNGGAPVNHADFIRHYLQVIKANYSLPPLADAGFWQRPNAAATGQPALLDGVAWSTNAKSHWRSYVVQLLDVSQRDPSAPTPPVFVLLLDTSEYDVSPVLVHVGDAYNAGENGSVRQDQIDDARRLLQAHVAVSPAPQPYVVVMGHHPYGALTKSAQSLLGSLFKDYRVVTYVSAHTHAAQYFVNGTKESNWLELNLGSVLDWSPEYRFFSLNQSAGKSGDGTPLVEMKTPQHQLESAWTEHHPKDPVADPSWEAKPNDPRYYLSFLDVGKFCLKADVLCAGLMQRKLMEVELHEMQYSIATFPTITSSSWPSGTSDDAAVVARINAQLAPNASLDDMVQLAKQLQDFDEVRQTRDAPGGSHRDYRLWQALWASMRMHNDTRLPDSSQGYFVFPVGEK